MNKRRNPDCPVVTILDIIGDKWSLIIIRDIFMGKHRYKDFMESKEKITTSILATRIKMLESEKIIFKKKYVEKPPRYEYFLTEKGSELKPILEEMVIWFDKNGE